MMERWGVSRIDLNVMWVKSMPQSLPWGEAMRVHNGKKKIKSWVIFFPLFLWAGERRRCRDSETANEFWRLGILLMLYLSSVEELAGASFLSEPWSRSKWGVGGGGGDGRGGWGSEEKEVAEGVLEATEQREGEGGGRGAGRDQRWNWMPGRHVLTASVSMVTG